MIYLRATKKAMKSMLQQDAINLAQSTRFVSAREYYCFKLQIRKGLFNIILFGGRLFEQWAVDMYIKIETMRLDWYSKPSNQKTIRADLYQGLVDTIDAGEARGDRIGKRIVLLRTFPGGDKDMQRRFLDAMAIVQRWGKPDYFITMTCNPYWEEITEKLLPGQLRQDRLDLVARVYKAKKRDMMNLLTKGKHFGAVAAYVHVTEFQKRGLPHEHILLIMKSDSKLKTPDDYDRVISAEIPDKEKFPVLQDLEDVVAKPSSSKSMLTEYFDMNHKYAEVWKWLYREFPEHYRWIAGDKKWQKRKNKRSQIRRLVYAHPAEGERYYLRVLLSHVRGATSFDDLKTVNGRLCGSYREACEQLGLIEHDKSIDDCITEAATFQMPCALRRLFATILVFSEATKIRKLWNKHLPSMSEDYRRDQPNEAALEQMVLRDIRDLVHSMGKDIRSYGLPDLVETDGSYEADYREVYEERQVTADQEHLDLIECLNSEQLAGFNDIMDHVTNQKSHTFFVDGPGGTGKTYLYKALLAKVRHMGLIAIATATSNIAASIMFGGRTAHSRFKIPIKLTDYSMCGFTKQSGTTELLK
ncbi:uncharacterized protein [Lolium perenne]|uniref:uncharacterized protein n=1 Tax=Lolium perenne TaxID=4522 RepID=UPI003A99A4B8